MRRYQVGFTLIEVLVVMVVLAVLVGLAAPSFRTSIQNVRTSAAGEELTAFMSYARSEAIRRGARVSVCPTANGTSCGGGWSQGFMVVLDASASDGTESVNLAEVLRVWEPPSNSKTEINGAPDFVRFLSTGIPFAVGGFPVTVSVAYPGCVGSTARSVGIGVSGTITLNKAECN
jgi:type IV fimbrial biogenesis protein FimT